MKEEEKTGVTEGYRLRECGGWAKKKQSLPDMKVLVICGVPQGTTPCMNGHSWRRGIKQESGAIQGPFTVALLPRVLCMPLSHSLSFSL